MRVLHFTDTLRLGGKERQLVELVKGMSRCDGIACEIATMARDVGYHDLWKLGITIHFLPRRSGKDLSVIGKLYTLCKRIKPDIIQTWGSFASLFAAPVCAITGIKFINGTIRKAPERLPLFKEDWVRSRLTFPFSDRIVANSFAGLRAYAGPKRRSLCIHNGFNLDRKSVV